MIEGIADIGRDHHLVAGPDPESAQGQLERRAAGADRGGGLSVKARRHLALERGDLRALGDVSRAHHRRDTLSVLLGERRSGVRDQMSSKSRTEWKASAYFTRAWMPRKFAHETADSRIVRSWIFVFMICDRWDSRQASFRSSTFWMST